jgi:YD repeat-containing protein
LPQGLEENLGRTTTYEYDKLGRRVRRFLPGASLDDVNAEKVTYTALGSAAAKTLHKEVRDFRGKTILYDYDAMDRLATKTLPQVTSGVDVARTVTYGYSGALLTQVSESGTGVARTTYYAYDSARRLRKKDTPEGVLTYTYNSRSQVERTQGFRRSSVIANVEVAAAVPDVDMEYGYDALGRLATVKDWKQSGANISTNFYDLAEC